MRKLPLKDDDLFGGTCMPYQRNTGWRWAGDAARLVATVEVAFAGLFAFPLHIGA
jgi:hypothetical protein